MAGRVNSLAFVGVSRSGIDHAGHDTLICNRRRISEPSIQQLTLVNDGKVSPPPRFSITITSTSTITTRSTILDAALRARSKFPIRGFTPPSLVLSAAAFVGGPDWASVMQATTHSSAIADLFQSQTSNN